MSAIIEVTDLTVELKTDGGWTRIVDEVSFAIGEQEVFGLAGESGSGKSMTAMAILGLLPRGSRVTGSVRLLGEELVGLPVGKLRQIRGKQVGTVFQDPMSSLHPALTIGAQIAETVRYHEKVSRSEAWARAVEVLDLVRIDDPSARAHQYPFELSGGMQQRVMMAMALSCRPRLLIADEPTTALDVTVQAQIVELLKSLQSELGMSVLFITHDLGLLAEIADVVSVMYAGQVVEMAPADNMFTDPRHPYPAALMSAIPLPEMKGRRLPTIAGTPLVPGSIAHGCRFRDRCEFASTVCEADQPLTPRPGGVVRCARADELTLTLSERGTS